MTNPLVTVLMPVYNGGDYLRLSIESILAQTYKYFEFLIINDCSTDNSMETVSSFKDERIVVHTNDVNMGQTKSLNVGLRMARGKYIVINDADDLSLPQRIEKQLDFIRKHPEYVVAGTSSFIMDRSGTIKRVFRKPTDQRVILLGILSDTPLIHGSVIINSEVILAHGGYNEKFRIIQDFELWSSLIRNEMRVANLPDILVVIRHYAGSTSFKEQDAQLSENGRTLLANIRALTNLNVLLDDAIRQRLFFFAPDSLNKDDFFKAEELFVNEYRTLNDKMSSENGFVTKDLKQKMMKPYSKIALAAMQKNRPREAQEIICRFLGKYGFSFVPFLILILAHFGKNCLDYVMYLHEKSQEILTNRYHYPNAILNKCRR